MIIINLKEKYTSSESSVANIDYACSLSILATKLFDHYERHVKIDSFISTMYSLPRLIWFKLNQLTIR